LQEKNKMKRPDQTGRRVPAFLGAEHRGLETRTATNPRAVWAPSRDTRRALSVAEALPRLAAQIGLSTGPQGAVEILPGTPTTIAFTAGGTLRGIVVLPADHGEARELLGFPPVATTDLVVERLWEEAREVPTPESLVAECW
jgi:hypothetical protein